MLRNIKFTKVPYCLGTKNKINNKNPYKVDNFIIVKDKTDTYKMIPDTCPHRGASLSKGYVKNDLIICPYHGWEFCVNDGSLQKMPSHKRIKPKCSLQIFNIKEDGGFLWKNHSHNFIENHCPELKDPKWCNVTGTKKVKGNWWDWVNNSLDMSHINYVHKFGDENNGEVSNFTTWNDNNYLYASGEVHPKPTNIFSVPIQIKKSQILTKFIPPYTTKIEVHLKNPHKFITFTTITPLTLNTSLISWSFLWTFGNNWLQNNSLIRKEFIKEMYKTVSEDEYIISNINEKAYGFSVPCDALQVYARKTLENKLNIWKTEQI